MDIVTVAVLTNSFIPMHHVCAYLPEYQDLALSNRQDFRALTVLVQTLVGF